MARAGSTLPSCRCVTATVDCHRHHLHLSPPPPTPLQRALDLLGHSVELAVAAEVVSRHTTDAPPPEPGLNLDEFAALVRDLIVWQEGRTADELVTSGRAAAAFKKADVDASGRISSRELAAALEEMGVEGTHAHVKEAIEKYTAIGGTHSDASRTQRNGARPRVSLITHAALPSLQRARSRSPSSRGCSAI